MKTLLDCTPNEVKSMFERFREKNDLCLMCWGVGCSAEDFGQGNTGKPCSQCRGRGFLKKGAENKRGPCPY